MNTTSDAAPTGGGGSDKRQGMLAVNDLTYVLPPDLSVSVNNTYKNHYFQQDSYTSNQRAICILNSGADYGDMRCSSLEFDVTLQDNGNTGNWTNGWFGVNGSAVNLIRTITISSRSGDELCRINDLNHLVYAQHGLRYSQEWVDTVGQAMGVNNWVDDIRSDYATVHFSIPLYVLSDLFGYGRLLPPMLLSGLRIEIEWEDPSIAFLSFNAATNNVVTNRAIKDKEIRQVVALQDAAFGTATAPDVALPIINTGRVVSGYTISQPFIALKSVQLTDGTQRALNELSAVNGLEIVYCDYERTQLTTDKAADPNVQLEVRKACSRALKAILRTRDDRDLTDPLTAPLVDSFATIPWDYDQWQWQLGSLYFPQQPVSSRGKRVNTIISESYKHALEAYGTYKGDSTRRSALTLSRFAGTNEPNLRLINPNKELDGGLPRDTQLGTGGLGININYDGILGSYANGNSVLACSLERSDLFNLSGVPINNSRVLSARVQYRKTGSKNWLRGINVAPATTTSGVDINIRRTITIFLKYVRLARVFLNNVEVEQ